jgi:phosphohistidine swiveling domain-containing protein
MELFSMIDPEEPKRSTTKASILVWMYGRLKNAYVPLSVVVSHGQWRRTPGEVIRTVRQQLGSVAGLIVRSSATSEDQVASTQAGRFLSVPDIVSDTQLTHAIDEVFRSYDSTGDASELFIQHMLSGASTVGVVFTADPATGSPYLVVNYAEDAKTSAITAGAGNYSKWVAIADGLLSPPIEDLRHIPRLVNELDDLLRWPAMDIEFAVVDGVINLLQVRPLTTARPMLSNAALVTFIRKAQATFDRWALPHPWLLGSSTLLGVMPDWNPAEIIGIRPRPLALSLYRFLVTDELWSVQRASYGYRNLSGVPLLVELNGMPFIDVRASLNSLIPLSLADGPAERLINACLSLLERLPELHDKLEFRVLPTCLSFDTATELERRFSATLDFEDRRAILRSLRALTASILENHTKIAEVDCALVNQMVRRREQLISRVTDLAHLAHWLLVDCAEFGTRPFVGQARRAFIATDILRSLVRGGAIEQRSLDAFMRNIKTVTSRFQCDLKSRDIDYLTREYGHLRPGTYDIRSPRYDEIPDLFLHSNAARPIVPNEDFTFSDSDKGNIQRFFDANQIAIDHDSFLEFARESIESRESSKFAFTRNLSDALKALTELGRVSGLDREALSFLKISDLLQSYPSTADTVEVIKDSIDRGRASFVATAALSMPSLVLKRDDMVSFVQSDDQPNFVGEHVVVGHVEKWSTSPPQSGSVLFIESADPGFDWIFQHELAAFVTMYGGSNSHMAIRAYELGLPAVIGAGPNLFNRWSRSRMVRIDPINKKVEIVQ